MNNTIALNKDIITSKTMNAVIGVVFFALATAFGAYIRIPIPGTPIPMTLQTFFVALSGAVLGKKLGTFSQASYIFLGIMGLPVFQGYGFGAAYVFGPTGGYLAGFMASSFLIGRMLQKNALNPYKIVVSFIAGNAVLYSLGVTWLMVIYRVSFINAITMGLMPFLAAEAVKIFAAAFIYHAIASRSKSIFS
jgi:biotin transport system substrate-specific component